ncbi:uncharacterized protein [Amphiura filiformis]|uniref:uncharacterized protein n=1 Tax=Amphiura filiformis TaxID=82378 RepID=UPI003B228447
MSSASFGSYRGHPAADTPLDPVYEYRDHRGRRNSRTFGIPDPHAFETKDDDTKQGLTKKQCILIFLVVFLILVAAAVASIVVLFISRTSDRQIFSTERPPTTIRPDDRDIEYIITPVLLTFDIPFLPEYANPASPQYRILENDVKEAVTTVFLYREVNLNTLYTRTEIRKFSQGSVVTDLFIYLVPLEDFFLSDSILSAIRAQIESILLAAIREADGPFSNLQPISSTLQVSRSIVQYAQIGGTTRRITPSAALTSPPERKTTTSIPPTTTKEVLPVTTTKSTTKNVPTTEEDVPSTRKTTTQKLPSTAVPPVPTQARSTSRQTTQPTTTTKEPTTTSKKTTPVSTTKKPTTTHVLPTTRKPTTTTVSTTTKDTEAPTITCPDDIMRTVDEGSDSVVVTWRTPQVRDSYTAAILIDIRSTHISGSNFRIGETTVRYTAMDLAGNEGYCEFTVTVIDDTPPIIFCPDDITVLGAPKQSTAEVTWSRPFASDNSFIDTLV